MIFKEFFNLIKAFCNFGRDFLVRDKNIEVLFEIGYQTIQIPDQIINGSVYLIQLFLLTKPIKCEQFKTIIPLILKSTGEIAFKTTNVMS